MQGKLNFIYNERGKAFDGKDYWSFDNDTARNVIIFRVDNTPLSYIDISRYKCLVLGKGPTERIDGSVGAAEKKLSF